MFLSKKILTALTLMGSVNAAVLKKRIDPNTSTCDTTSNFLWESLSILIGVPYGGPQACDNTYYALESATSSVSNWQCVEENGYIRLWFNVINNAADAVNSALGSQYQDVSFNCHNA